MLNILVGVFLPTCLSVSVIRADISMPPLLFRTCWHVISGSVALLSPSCGNDFNCSAARSWCLSIRTLTQVRTELQPMWDNKQEGSHRVHRERHQNLCGQSGELVFVFIRSYLLRIVLHSEYFKTSDWNNCWFLIWRHQHELNWISLTVYSDDGSREEVSKYSHVKGTSAYICWDIKYYKQVHIYSYSVNIQLMSFLLSPNLDHLHILHSIIEHLIFFFDLYLSCEKNDTSSHTVTLKWYFKC